MLIGFSSVNKFSNDLSLDKLVKFISGLLLGMLIFEYINYLISKKFFRDFGYDSIFGTRTKSGFLYSFLISILFLKVDFLTFCLVFAAFLILYSLAVRSPWILILSTLFFVKWRRSNTFTKIIILVGLPTTFIVGRIFIFHEAFYKYFTDTGQINLNTSGRLEALWPPLVEKIKHLPILGYGWGAADDLIYEHTFGLSYSTHSQ